MCWANKIFFIMVFFLALASFLSGCGNKGKLYLPDNNKKPAVNWTLPVKTPPTT